MVPNSFDKNYVRNTTDIDFEHIEISNLSNDEFNINNGVINSDYEAKRSNSLTLRSPIIQKEQNIQL